MEEEFLKDVVHGVARNADEAVREREGGALVVREDVVRVEMAPADISPRRVENAGWR